MYTPFRNNSLDGFEPLNMTRWEIYHFEEPLKIIKGP